MSRFPQDRDPNAAKYSGSDPAAAQTFENIQRLLRSLLDPPLVRVIGQRSEPGYYNGYEIDGALPVDGSAPPPNPYFGGQLNQRLVCVVCPGDFGTGAWSIPIPRTLASGVRRQGLNGETVIVVDYWGQGDPNGTGVPPGDDGPGGGSVGGSGGLGADPSGLCSLNYAVTIAGVSGTGHDSFFNDTFTLTWTGFWWIYGVALPWDPTNGFSIVIEVATRDPVTGLPSEYSVQFTAGPSLTVTFLAYLGPPVGNSGCPALGLYVTNAPDTTNGGTATVA